MFLPGDGDEHVGGHGCVFQPIAAVAMTFHVGSTREVAGKTGFAHLFEHLFFLDSENLGPGGLDKLMTRLGSATNGSTTGNRIKYHEVVPIDGLEKAPKTCVARSQSWPTM